MDSDAPDSGIEGSIAKLLSRGGHGFHYAVMRRAEELRIARKSRWALKSTEFPVAVKDDVTHVDFVLAAEPGRTHLVAECKRVDPARSRWCFVPTPYTWRDSNRNDIVFEEVHYHPPTTRLAQATTMQTDQGVYHLGLELRTRATGEGSNGRNAINQAAAQVLRGMNGVINHLFGRDRRPPDGTGRARFVPVIFTTAEVWVSATDLGSSDLTSGRVGPSNATKVPWVWFTHNQSPAITHDLRRRILVPDLSTDLQAEFARTIAVVAPEGIDRFLAWDMESWFD